MNDTSAQPQWKSAERYVRRLLTTARVVTAASAVLVPLTVVAIAARLPSSATWAGAATLLGGLAIVGLIFGVGNLRRAKRLQRLLQDHPDPTPCHVSTPDGGSFIGQPGKGLSVILTTGDGSRYGLAWPGTDMLTHGRVREFDARVYGEIAPRSEVIVCTSFGTVVVPPSKLAAMP